MLTPPPKPPPIPIPIGGKEMPPCTPEEVLVNKLFQMAVRGEFAPGITAETLAAAKSQVFEKHDQFDEECITRHCGGETVLHDAAQFGNYPPGTTLKILAETKDARNTSALEVAFEANRAQGLALPPCCSGPALAKLKIGSRTALHFAMFYGVTPTGTTPKLLAETGYDGWTALHAGADNGFLLPGTTLQLLKAIVTPPNGPSVANFSALDAFLEQIERDIRDGVKPGDRFFPHLQASVNNLMRASLNSVPNVADHKELHNLAMIFSKFAPEETAMWFAAELAEMQQRAKPNSGER
jgi:hypothetical protein